MIEPHVIKVARKLAMVEADLERAEERAELGEKYVLLMIRAMCSTWWNFVLICFVHVFCQSVLISHKIKIKIRYYSLPKTK